MDFLESSRYNFNNKIVFSELGRSEKEKLMEMFINEEIIVFLSFLYQFDKVSNGNYEAHIRFLPIGTIIQTEDNSINKSTEKTVKLLAISFR